MLSTVRTYVEQRVAHAVRRGVRNATLILLALLLVLIALLFALLALFLFAATQIGPVWAAAAMAGGLVVLALILLLVVRLAGSRARKTPRAPLDQALADDAVEALGLNDPKKRKSFLYQALAAAVLAGFYAGRKIG